MVEIQIINKILTEQSLDFLLTNKLNISLFHKKYNELKYIIEHNDTYGCVPDKETFIKKFPDFEFFIVNESSDYLVATLLENDRYERFFPIIQKAADLLQTDANEAVNYMIANIEQVGDVRGKSIDLISQADIRYNQYLEMQVYKAKMVTYTGFKELDRVIEGFSNDELAVFFARLNNGKSWVVTKIAVAAWEQGRRVGFYSGEMSAEKVGYRIDSIIGGFSNRSLLKGYKIDGYKDYIESMRTKNVPIQIITPTEIDGYLTITKLEQFIRENKIEFMVIDQLSLMVDETATKTTQERSKFSNLTKGLRRLSKKYDVPIIVAAQANRLGAKGPNEKGLPEMENIAESDAVGQDATLAISMRMKDNQLEMEIKKYRDGMVGNKFVYALDLDHGKFNYLPSDESSEYDVQASSELKNNFDDGKEVF